MKPRIAVDQGTYRFLYRRYKEYLLPILIILASVLLFLNLLIPQTKEYFKMREEEKIYREKVKILGENVAFLTNLDIGNLNSSLETASAALPFDKDFFGILQSIAGAGASSGVLLSDYSFSVGELSTKSATLSASPSRPSIGTSLDMEGDTGRTNNFIKNLSERVPLSDTLTITSEKTKSKIQTVFYYRPYAYSNPDPEVKILPLSSENQALINTLELWKSSSGGFEAFLPGLLSPSATSSGGVRSSPFSF